MEQTRVSAAEGQPSIAVVIPSYNHARFIGEALASVFRQTRLPREVHVIDDGSTDDSVRAIERAFASAGPVRCSLSVRTNRGTSATRNELCAAVSTDFVALLDSDDVYAPDRLQRLLAGVSPNLPFLGFSGVNFLGNETEIEGWDALSHWQFAQGLTFPTVGFALLRSNLALTNSNFVVSRSLLELVGGFDERLRICQDWDFVVRALRFVEPTFVPDPLVSYRLHATNTSRHAAAYAHELDLLAEKMSEWLLRPTDNPVAPTPMNWPRLFRIFVRLNQTPIGRALAARLPREALTAKQEASQDEVAALHALVDGARVPDSLDALPRHELMRRCAEAWSVRS
jgi:glycosyltransferase involved in cell wall biosynthesis